MRSSEERASDQVDGQSIELTVRTLAQTTLPQRDALIHAVVNRLAAEDLHGFVRSLDSAASDRLHQYCADEIGSAERALRTGDLPTAQRVLESVIRLDMTNWRAHQQLGAVLEERGCYAVARTQYVLAFHFGWDDDDAREAIDRVSERAQSSEGQCAR